MGIFLLQMGMVIPLRKVDANTGIITTIAGNGTPGYSGDGGPAANALVNFPYGMVIDKQNNIVFRRVY
jgi:hypothetical protein